jgi:hypothetical protein
LGTSEPAKRTSEANQRSEPAKRTSEANQRSEPAKRTGEVLLPGCAKTRIVRELLLGSIDLTEVNIVDFRILRSLVQQQDRVVLPIFLAPRRGVTFQP